MKKHIKNYNNEMFSSHLADENIPIEWHWLWDQVQKYYGDVKKLETETIFVNRVRRVVSLEDGWMDIETAPKDGTIILIIESNYNGHEGCWVASWSIINKWWNTAGTYLPKPTHWRKLPEPPKL